MFMKKYLFFALLPLLAFQTINWEWYTSEPGRFTVLTPGTFTLKSDTIDTEIGQMVYHTYFHQPEKVEEADNFLYMVSYVDYPEGSVHSDSTDLVAELLETSVLSSIESVKGSLYYESDISLNDFPGKIWRVNYGDDQAVIKTKAYIVYNRFYSVQTITYRDKSLNTAADKFLDSFKLTGG